MTLKQYIEDQRTNAQLDQLARLQDSTREALARQTLADIDNQPDQAKKLITVSQDHDHAYDPYRHWELITK